MGIFIKSEKIQFSKIRRIPFLPRIGIVVELGDKRLAYKYVPVIETIVNLLDGPLTLSRLKNIVKNQFAELQFPSHKEKTTFDTTAKSHFPVLKE